MRRELRQHPKPPNVDNPSLSPVHLKRAREQFRIPVSGVWKILVLLVDFSDHPAQFYAGAAAKPHFVNLLLSKGTYPQGSMRDWYQEVSYGVFDIGGVVQTRQGGWLRAPRPYAYYAYKQRGFGPYPHNSGKLAEDVIPLIDPYVDFSDYDNDGDGTADGLIIVHTGPGYETTGRLSDLHSSAWGGLWVFADGVRVGMFSILPEDGKIGVFGHEYGHMIGLPDLYDSDYDSAGIGMYSMMASGSWAGNGNRPVHLDAYCKELLAWSKPTVVTSAQPGAVVPAAETSPTVYRLKADEWSQYFLVENRQRLGFDTLLPAEGLLIWHVDPPQGQNQQWYPGLPAMLHYGVALEQADGQWALEHFYNYGDEGDSFPGATGSRTFNAATTPSSRDYWDDLSHVTVSNISASGATMTADLCGVNRAPLSPEWLSVTPKAPLPSSVLRATARVIADPDGEPCTPYYSWSQWNGSAWGPWGHASSDGRLTGVTLKRGDRWQARVRVSDEELFSVTRRSAAVTVGGAIAQAGPGLSLTAAVAPAAARGAAVSINLSAPAAVAVEVRNLAGRLVGIVPERELNAGVSNLLWNGCSTEGTAVPAGRYLVKVTARAAGGAQSQVLSSAWLGR